MWTGFLYESLNDFQKEVISYVDVLIDGQFKEELKDLSLQFRGSSNQRIIDIKESIKQERVVLWQD
jgi:anaerobic ribonucleoside-triphosphate reductase activating protein